MSQTVSNVSQTITTRQKQSQDNYNTITYNQNKTHIHKYTITQHLHTSCTQLAQILHNNGTQNAQYDKTAQQ